MNFQFTNENIAILSQVLAVIIFAFLIYIAKKIILSKAVKKLKGNKNLLNYEAFLSSVKTPSSILIWLFTLIIILNTFKKHNIDFYLLTVMPVIVEITALFVVVMFVLKFIPKVEKNYHTVNKKKYVKLDKTATTALVQLVKSLVVIIALIMAFQTLGYNLTGLLAIGGAGGIIVGLAAKDTIANLFGGVMLHIERPFAIGDSILSNDHKSIAGTVEHIGMRTTRILTFEKRPLYIPNSLFMTITIENTTRMKNRRMKELIGLRYDDIDKLPEICKDIKEMVSNHEGIDNNLTILVNVNEFASSSINILLFAFTNSGAYVDFVKTKEDIFLKITKIVQKHGADFAFPTVTTNIPNPINIQNLPMSS